MLSTRDILAIVLGTGAARTEPTTLANQVLLSAGSLVGIARMPLHELSTLPGMSEIKAVQIHAALDLTRRMAMDAVVERPIIRCPADVVPLLMPDAATLEQEHLRTMFLDARNRVIGQQEIYKGSLTTSQIRVGELFKEAIRRNCAALMVAHNHPSGDPSPSADDVSITRIIAEAGKLLDIPVLDHLIVGHGAYVSLKERGVL